MNNKKISVIIPVWQGRQHLPACLDAVLAQDKVDFEVIAVDNASLDGSAEWVAENYPKVRLIRNSLNFGFAGACNIGMGGANGDILVLLNQDTQMRQGCLLALTRALEDLKIGVVGCKILYPEGKTIQHAGGGISWPLGFTHHIGQGEIDTGTWDTPREVEYVTGAAVAFRRDLIAHIGLLDEGFWPGYFEDVDFCLRAREAGYQVWYTPEAVLVHSESTSIENKTIALQFGHRGRLRLVLKHLPPERFLDQFVPAEESNHLGAVRSRQGKALRMAYLEAMLRADSILRECWRSDPVMIYQVVTALKYLYQQAWDKELRDLIVSTNLTNSTAISRVKEALQTPAQPPREATFQSQFPIVDFVVAPLRKLLYRVVARPAVEHLMQQQQATNQNHVALLQAVVESQVAQSRYVAESQVAQSLYVQNLALELADENAMLAGESVRLALGISEQHAAPYRDRDL